MNITITTPPPFEPVKTPNFSGIYSVTCCANGKLYIGSAVWIAKRWRHHRVALRAGKHHCSRLQRAWNKYGDAAFVFAVVEACEPGELIAKEQSHMDATRAADRRHGFNSSPVAGSNLGLRFSSESRRRVAEAAANRPKRELTPEAREALAAKMRGNKFALGYRHTDETRAQLAISASRSRRPHKKNFSPEALRKTSERFAGKPLPEWHREKIALALSGRELSQEHRQRLAIVQRKFTDEQVAEMRALRDGGMRFEDLNSRYGCSANTLRKIIRRTGVYA